MEGLITSTIVRTHAYFTMVFHHDKLGHEHKPKKILERIQRVRLVLCASSQGKQWTRLTP